MVLETVFTCQNLWAAALKSYDHAWKANDGRTGKSDRELLCQMQAYRSDGLESPVRDILTEYRIQGRRKGLVTRLECYVRSSNFEDDAKKSLTERSGALANYAEELAGKDCNRHYSAFSKVTWFGKPKNWTLYDSLAANALLNRERKQNNQPRMVQFYSRLDELNVSSWWAITRNVLREAKYESVYAERVLDQALVILGGVGAFRRLFNIVNSDEDTDCRKVGQGIAEATKETEMSAFLSREWALQ